MGVLPPAVQHPIDNLVDAGTQAAAPLVDLAEQGREDVANAFSSLSQEAQQVATSTYDKVAGWLAGLATTVQEYADALGQLTPEQFSKFMEFVNAVDSLKGLSTAIRALQSHFDGIQFKDLLSGENKAYAIALAENTASFLNLFNQIVQILSDLLGLFGDSLKNKLRGQNLPLLNQLLAL